MRNHDATAVDHERPATSIRRRSVNATVTLVMACVASMLLVSFLVVTSSRAAFTASTENTANSVASGVLTLTDNDGGTTALFNYTGVYPGWSQERCIKVVYSSTLLAGTQPGPVKLYLSAAAWTAPAEATTAAGNLKLQIDQGTEVTNPDSFGDCAGFGGTTASVLASTTLGTLTTATYSSGISYTQWQPVGTNTETRFFKFTISLPSSATNIETASTGAFAFKWETQK